MFNEKDLKDFIIAANKQGYASNQEREWTKESDKSTSINYSKGDWKLHDNFFGGEPYGGRLVISFKDQPVWMMVYYGWVTKGQELDPVYSILREALKRMPEEYPFRGPEEYQQENYTYSNKWEGDISKYSGEEIIKENGNLVYKANYFGGLVDQIKEN